MTEILISSTVLIAVLIALRQIFKNRISRRLQYGLWLVAALRLALPIQFGISPISIDRSPTVERLETAITQTAREPVSGPSYTVIYSQVAEEFSSAGQNVQSPAIAQQIRTETTQRIQAPTLGEIVNGVWLTGACAMAVWFLLVNLRFRHILRENAREVTVADCPIPVKICPSLTSPCLSGIFRPTVYLTESCATDPQRLKHILAHELTHLRHGDLFWSVVRCVLLCVYWFHPLVWVTATLSKRDCELACDEGALARLGEDQRIPYGKTLLDTVARTRSPHHLLETATSMNETKKQLKERVNYIVKKPRFYLILTVCLLLITAVAIGCTFTGAPQPTLTPPETTEPTRTTTPATDPTEPSLFDQALLDEITSLFTGYYNMRTNWYNAAMLATFNSPQEIDAFDLFSVGTGDPKDRQLTDEELAYLRGTIYMDPDIDHGNIPCRMTRDYVESVLDQFFGLTTADLKTEDQRFLYWEKTDCYYVVSEGHAALDFRLLGAVRQEDGTILFEYYDPYAIEPKYIYETVIRPVSNGYHVLSNRIIAKSNLNPNAKPVTETWMGPDPIRSSFYDYRYNANWLYGALRCTFATAADVDLYALLYNQKTEDSFSQQERNFLLANGMDPEADPVHKFSVSTMDGILQTYFGITFKESNGIGLDKMLYNPETDSYYCRYSGFSPGRIAFITLQTLEDGTILLYNEHQTDTPSGPRITTLIPTEGGYQIVSNVPAPVEPIPMDKEAITQCFQDRTYNTNWLYTALNSVYATPADVDLLMLFYCMPTEELTQEEIDFAVSNGLRPDIAPIHRYSVAMMDSVLQTYFGITFEECNGVGLDQMLYNPDTDCYYHDHGGAEFVNFNPSQIQQAPDGTLRIYYDAIVGNQYRSMVATLVPAEDSWHIVSNITAADLPAYTDAPWYPATEGEDVSYAQYFSKVRPFSESRTTYVTCWGIGADGTLATIYFDSTFVSGYALCRDEDGFFIVGFDDEESIPAKLIGYRRDKWFYLNSYTPPLEIIWDVPNSGAIGSVSRYLTDGKYAYCICNEDTIFRLDLLTGEVATVYHGDPIPINDDECMILYDRCLYFLTQSGNDVSINRVYLPEMKHDVLYSRIPADSRRGCFFLYCPDSDTVIWTTLNPDTFTRLWEIIQDPNSSAYNKHTKETVKYHDIFRRSGSIMECTDNRSLTAHKDFIDLAQFVEIFEETPALTDYTLTLSTGRITENPRYWDPEMRE